MIRLAVLATVGARRHRLDASRAAVAPVARLHSTGAQHDAVAVIKWASAKQLVTADCCACMVLAKQGTAPHDTAPCRSNTM